MCKNCDKASKAYQKAIAPELEAYQKVIASAWKAYEKKAGD